MLVGEVDLATNSIFAEAAFGQGCDACYVDP